MDIRPAVVNEIGTGDQVYMESIITNDNEEAVYKKRFKNLITLKIGLWTQ